MLMKIQIFIRIVVVTVLLLTAMSAADRGDVINIGMQWTSGDITLTLEDSVTLRVRGKGRMLDYKDYNDDTSKAAPWTRANFTFIITNLIIDDGITHIGARAFEISNLRSLKIPNSVTSIGRGAFINCTRLTSITLPNGIISIEPYTFGNCRSLTSVVIPDRVTSIGKSAFAYCENLVSINIPDGISSITDETFYYCINLASVKIPNNVTSIGKSAFGGCERLDSITIPDNVTSIGDFAFSGCSNLVSVTISNRLMSIGVATFWRCDKLVSITIPKSVTSIGNGALAYCKSLASVISLNPVPPKIEKGGWISEIKDDACLYVPTSSVNLYRTVNGWSRPFECIKPIESALEKK